MKRRGFTLLEVMVAAALLSIVTAGAMAAFIAQSRITNSQQSTSQSNDFAREAIRLISNDVRTMGPGIGSSALSSCAPGSIPFDMGAAIPACLPPVFRSSSPINAGQPQGAGLPAGYGTCGSAANPGYALTFPNGVVEPSVGNLFCPDDLVIVAVDDANPLFMIQGNPGTSSTTNRLPLLFVGTATPARGSGVGPNFAGYGLDDAAPHFPPPPALGVATPAQPLMLFGGSSGAVLMNVGCTNQTPGQVCFAPPGQAYTTSNGCTTAANCWVQSYGLVPTTPQINLYPNNLDFGAVAMPAQIVQYSIQPVNAQGLPTPGPFVSANLLRTIINPAPVVGGGGGGYAFRVASGTVVAQGVLDMQVEFGFPDPNNATDGELVYVNSGGMQSAPWVSPQVPPPPAPVAAGNLSLNNCAGGTLDSTVYSGVCFPNNGRTAGGASYNALNQLRTVRVSLTLRSGANINTRSSASVNSAAAVSDPFYLQPGVQDLTTSNVEGASWGFSGATPYVPGSPPPPGVFLTQDGASYRQISSEIYMRNIGWSNGS